MTSKGAKLMHLMIFSLWVNKPMGKEGSKTMLKHIKAK